MFPSIVHGGIKATTIYYLEHEDDPRHKSNYKYLWRDNLDEKRDNLDEKVVAAVER